MGNLQNDYLSIQARTLVPYLKDLSFENKRARELRDLLLDWDFKLEKNSILAGIYVMWERKIIEKIKEISVPKEVMDLVGTIQMTRVINWIEHPELLFSSNSALVRDKFLVNCFELALQDLETKLGKNSKYWQYGQTSFKHAYIRHPLSPALSDDWKEKLDAGPVPRGGYSFTPSANGHGDNNTSGASFRMVVDTGDWEKKPLASILPDNQAILLAHFTEIFSPFGQQTNLSIYHSDTIESKKTQSSEST